MTFALRSITVKYIHIGWASIIAVVLTSCITSTYTVGWGDTGALTFKSRAVAIHTADERLAALGQVLTKDGYRLLSDSAWTVDHAYKITILETGPADRREHLKIKSELVEYPEPREWEWKFHVHYSISARSTRTTRSQATPTQHVDLAKLKTTHPEKHPYVKRVIDSLRGEANKASESSVAPAPQIQR